MSARLQSKPLPLRRERTEAVVLEDDRWVWGVIFTAAALSGLCVAALFSVTIV
jgi:hypothetical protein